MVQLCDHRVDGLIERPEVALTLRLMTDVDELAPLRTSWALLAQESRAAYPFMLSTWVEACLRHRDTHVRPAVLVGTRADSLELVWPLAVQGRLPGRRRLFFAAEGPSDYQSLLMRGEDDELFTRALRFLEERVVWDVLDLYPLPDEEAHRYAHAWGTREGRLVTLERVGSAPYLDLRDGWEVRVDRRLRHTVEQKCRRLTQRLGPVTLRGATDEPSVDQLLSGLYDLHIRRWADTPTPSNFVKPVAQARYRAMVRAWLERGILGVYGLYVGERLIAVHVGAQAGDRFYSHVAAFEADLQRYSPGTVLLWMLLQRCAAAGVRVFDFLRGDESYKLDWGAVNERGYWRLRVYRQRPGAAVLIRGMEHAERFLGRHPKLRHAARRMKGIIDAWGSLTRSDDHARQIEAAGTTLRFRLMTDLEELAPIRAQWDALARSCGIASPFMLSGWLNACLRPQEDHGQPAIIAGFRDGSLALVWPLARRGKIPGRRRLFFAGSGPSDYQTLLVSTREASMLQAAIEFILSRPDWDFLDLHPLIAHEADRLREAFNTHPELVTQVTQLGLCPWLALDAQWASRVDHAVLTDVQYQWRRLQKIGTIELRMATDDAAFERLLEGLIELDIRRRAQTSAPSRLVQAAARTRLRAQAMAWREAGVLALHGLFVNDQLIAAHLGARTAERFYYYLPTFHPAWRRYSPGKVLLWRLLEECAHQAMPWVDFLRGDEPYKRQWGASSDVAYARLCVWRTPRLLKVLPGLQARTERWLTQHPALGRRVRSVLRRLGA